MRTNQSNGMRRIGCILLLLSGWLSCSADVPQNQPPTVTLSVSTELNVVVGDTVRIVINAVDPEGGGTQFGWDYRPNDRTWSLGSAVFLEYASQAVFEWSPIASDTTPREDPLRLIFIAEDTNGKRTEKVVLVSIVPGNGQPRFVNSSSELYDPRTAEPLEVRIRVRDDDSSNVAVTMPQTAAPVGASFQQFEALEGVFRWEPSLEQLSKRVHSVLFVADDGQNDPVEFVLTIVIRSRGEITLDEGQVGENCPGEEMILHEPLGPQSGLDDYVFEASLTAAGAQRYESMYLYWTYGDAFNGGGATAPSDEDRFQSIEMDREGERFVATVRNQSSIIGADGVLRIFYTLCAVDDDSGDSTSVICAPSLGDLDLYYGFLAYSPDVGEDCVDDALDLQSTGNDSIETASSPSTERWDGFQVCGGDPDFFSLRIRPGESYVLGITYPKGQDIQIQAFDESRTPISLSFSSCTGLATLERAVAEGQSPETVYVEVTGDNVAYQVRSFRKGGSTTSCVDDALEPNDDAFDATPVNGNEQIDAEICSGSDLDVYEVALGGGDEISVTTRFLNAQGNLDMTLYSPSQFQDISATGTGVAQTFSFEDQETLNYTVEEAGDYFLVVFTNDSPNRYEIGFDVQRAPPCTDDDEYSAVGGGNHVQSAAAPIALYSDAELELCPGRPDWYQRTVFPGAPILGELTVRSGGSIDDIVLEVYDQQGQRLQEGVPVGQGLDIDIANDGSQAAQYYIKVLSAVAQRYQLYLVN